MFACRFFFKCQYIPRASFLNLKKKKKKKANIYSLGKSLKALICKNHISKNHISIPMAN